MLVVATPRGLGVQRVITEYETSLTFGANQRPRVGAQFGGVGASLAVAFEEFVL